MSENMEEVELARQVEGYQRRTESGKVVTVRGYVRTDNSVVADTARKSPGRPSVAAGNGSFPSGRAIPVWPDAGKTVNPQESEEAPVEYEGIDNTGVVDQEGLDKEVPIMLEIISKFPKNPSLTKLIGILKSLSTASLSVDPEFDPEILELARRGVVRVTGYSYVSKKTGKVVRVNPYTQIRSLISMMGGPQMAARKGVTPDLLDAAMPGYQVKDKAFKAKAPKKTMGSAKRVAGKVSTADAMRKLNELKIDREFDVPKPKPGDDYMKKAMSTQNPLESVRSSLEGSQVVLGNNSWVRAMDGLWYKTPRRNNKGITDRQITKAIASKGGRVELSQGYPPKRKDFSEQSKVDYDVLNPNSKNYADAVKFSKALEPTFRNLPEGIGDSINGHMEVRRPSNGVKDGITRTSMTKANDYYPKMFVNPDPDFQADVMKTLPRQQAQGYSVPSTMHPMETVMTRESSKFIESVMGSRAPADMVDRMYDRLSKAYDKTVKEDNGDYSGLSGLEGWVARMSGERSDALKKELKEGLSMSALNSPEDFLAEAWTEFVGHPSPRQMSLAMSEAFQKSMEEFSDYMFKNGWVDASEIPDAVVQRTTKKSPSRKISDAIGGDSDHTIDTPLAPRDLRSVINQSSRYIDIRDEDGNPTFDANITREGDKASISTLTYPTTDPSAMPTGIPNIPRVDDADPTKYYFSPPLEDLAKGPDNQKRYAQYIDQTKALKAIEAMEESLFSEGVKRIDVSPRGGEDSVLYARAGYQFDPQTTDAYEITNMINDVEELINLIKSDANAGFWVLPPNVQRSVGAKVRKWHREMTSDPATWPSPQDIAKLGKLKLDEMSIGEAVLDRYSWSGVKDLDGKKFEKWAPEAPKPTDDGYHTMLPILSVSPDMPTASALGGVARAITPKVKDVTTDTPEALRKPSKTKDMSPEDKERTKMLKEAMTDLVAGAVSRHQDRFPDTKVMFAGNPDDYRVSVKDNKTGKSVFSLTIKKNEAGETEWIGPTYEKNNLAAAFLSTSIIDDVEAAYQQSDTPYIWKYPKKEDSVASYVLASTGYTWKNPPTKDQLSTVFDREIDVQVEYARGIGEQAAVLQFKNGGSTADLVAAQTKLNDEMTLLRQSLTSQANAYLEKFDNDEEGPHPFEIAQFGKKEAYKTARARSLLPVRSVKDITADMATPLKAGATAQEIKEHKDKLRHLENELERAKRREGTVFQQMMSIDGDALHDSFIEFVGKQALTLGTYGWHKSLGGYWKWATDSYNPSARKYSVGLLFMLLRLMPASVLRGGLMYTTNAIVKKIKSPRPEDWPSKQEIADLIEEIEAKIPDEKLKGLK